MSAKMKPEKPEMLDIVVFPRDFLKLKAINEYADIEIRHLSAMNFEFNSKIEPAKKSEEEL